MKRFSRVVGQRIAAKNHYNNHGNNHINSSSTNTNNKNNNSVDESSSRLNSSGNDPTFKAGRKAISPSRLKSMLSSQLRTSDRTMGVKSHDEASTMESVTLGGTGAVKLRQPAHLRNQHRPNHVPASKTNTMQDPRIQPRIDPRSQRGVEPRPAPKTELDTRRMQPKVAQPRTAQSKAAQPRTPEPRSVRHRMSQARADQPKAVYPRPEPKTTSSQYSYISQQTPPKAIRESDRLTSVTSCITLDSSFGSLAYKGDPRVNRALPPPMLQTYLEEDHNSDTRSIRTPNKASMPSPTKMSPFLRTPPANSSRKKQPTQVSTTELTPVRRGGAPQPETPRTYRELRATMKARQEAARKNIEGLKQEVEALSLPPEEVPITSRRTIKAIQLRSQLTNRRTRRTIYPPATPDIKIPPFRHVAAAIVLQSYMRRFIAVNFRFERLVDIIIIQSAFRRYLAKVYLSEVKQSIVLCQSVARRWLAYGIVERHELVRDEEERDRIYWANRAAALIQAAWRSYDTRMDFVCYKHKVIFAQRTVRRYILENPHHIVDPTLGEYYDDLTNMIFDDDENSVNLPPSTFNNWSQFDDLDGDNSYDQESSQQHYNDDDSSFDIVEDKEYYHEYDTNDGSLVSDAQDDSCDEEEALSPIRELNMK